NGPLAGAGDAQIGELEAPGAVDLLRPGVGRPDAAGVVPEAAIAQRREQARALAKIGRAEAFDVAEREFELHLMAEAVVGTGRRRQRVEGVKFLRPFRRRPAGAVEMPDGMRSDLVAFGVQRFDVLDAPAHAVGRAAEIDAGVAALVA